jgi:hypothetical protein
MQIKCASKSALSHKACLFNGLKYALLNQRLKQQLSDAIDFQRDTPQAEMELPATPLKINEMCKEVQKSARLEEYRLSLLRSRF